MQEGRRFPWVWFIALGAVAVIVFMGYSAHNIFKSSVELADLLREDANRPNVARVAINRAFADVDPSTLTLSRKWNQFVNMQEARWKLNQNGVVSKPVVWGDSLLNVNEQEAIHREVRLAAALGSQLMSRLRMSFNERVQSPDALWTTMPTELYGRLWRVSSQYGTIIGIYEPDAYAVYLVAMQRTPEEIASLEKVGRQQDANLLAKDFLSGTVGENARVHPGDLNPDVVQRIKATYGQPST